MEVKVYKADGSEAGRNVVLDARIFGVEPNDHAIYLDVKRILAAKRQGTADAKERSEMSGSTRKLFRQKGTGGARRGDINSPLLKGGARVFGPKPRDYDMKINKKVRALARYSALTYKANSSEILVLENTAPEQPKTRFFVDLLKNLNLSDKKTLFVLDVSNKIVYLSSRNLQKVKVVTASELNTYDVLNAKNIVFFEAGLKKLEEMMLNS